MRLKLAPNLQEQVASHLRLRILSGQIEPGTPFREQVLAEEFGVSRGPIRDALLTLTKEGLLQGRPNVGVRVAEAPSPFTRAVIVNLRRDIESAALLHWFALRDPELPGRLDANLAEYQRACTSSEFGRVVELDMAFHRLLVESADGGSLVDVWLPVILRMFLRYSRHRLLVESFQEHAAIVAAMHAGDEATAVARLRQHIV
jgi:DNA-binding GntR family transcriptional regulator